MTGMGVRTTTIWKDGVDPASVLQIQVTMVIVGLCLRRRGAVK